MPKNKAHKPAADAADHFQSEAFKRLRAELKKLGIKGMRATLPKDFPAATREEAMTISGEWKIPPAHRPKGKTPATIAKLERIAKLQAAGLKLYEISKRIKMNYNALRRFVSRNRVEYEHLKQGLK
jgi:hypothetical protein